MSDRTSNLLLSDIRKVTLQWQRGGPPTSYLIHKDEVPAFVEASKRLHFDPGVNPATGGRTARIWQIIVAPLEFTGPYWWSTPDLGRNEDPAGARIIDGRSGKEVFVDQEYVDRLNAEEDEMEDAWERRNG